MLEVQLPNDRVFQRPVADENVVDGRRDLVGLDPDAAGGVSLGISIDQQSSLLGRGETRGEVYSSRCFSDAALLVRYRDDTGHNWLGLEKLYGGAIGDQHEARLSWKDGANLSAPTPLYNVPRGTWRSFVPRGTPKNRERARVSPRSLARCSVPTLPR